MIKFKLTILCLFISVLMSAQNVDQYLISSVGGSNDILQWSGGETVITTLNGPESTITQGFHQTLLTVTAIEENVFSEIEFMVFPNPFRNSIQISQQKGSFRDLKFTLTDISGQLILAETLHSSHDEFNLESLASGIYFLNIQLTDKSVKTYKVVKQN